MSKVYRLAIIGFGNVGQGLASILADKHGMLEQNFGVNIKIVAVCDLSKGSNADPDGLDPQQLLDAVANTDSPTGIDAPVAGWDASETIAIVVLISLWNWLTPI